MYGLESEKKKKNIEKIFLKTCPDEVLGNVYY